VSDLWVNVVIVLFFVLLGGFFAAAEIALVSLRESQVQRLEETSKRGPRLAQLVSDPSRFLAAVQVGVTLAGFVSAGFGAAQIAPELATVFESWGWGPGVAGVVSFILITIVIAYVSLVLGELVPKRIALQRAEKVALFVAGPINVIARVFRPFIVALSASTNAIVRMFGINPREAKEQISGEELRDLVAAHEELSVEERALIDDVFAVGDRELREVMIPRTEVDFLDASLLLSQAVTVISDKPHSRYPVIQGSADDVVGFVHIRDLLDPAMSGRQVRLGELARQVTSYPGTKVILSTLTEMRRLRQHIAIVQDEYGGTAGIVTLEDLVEEVIGDIKDEYDAAETPRAPRIVGEITVDGLMNIEDFSDECDVSLPDGPYETVAGFMVSHLSRLPALGDTVEASGLRFEVSELDGRRIAKVHVTRLPE
jgi:putative hemolysin